VSAYIRSDFLTGLSAFLPSCLVLKAIPPMMAVSAATLPVGADWSYEVKWDGYRAQAVKDGPAVSLASRNLKNVTRQYPAIAAAAARVRAKTAKHSADHGLFVDDTTLLIGSIGPRANVGTHHRRSRCCSSSIQEFTVATRRCPFSANSQRIRERGC
jgi:hypothetical protein